MFTVRCGKFSLKDRQIISDLIHTLLQRSGHLFRCHLWEPQNPLKGYPFIYHYDHTFPPRFKRPKSMKHGASNAANRNLLKQA